MHVSVAAETLFKLGPLPVTNSLLVTFMVSVLLVLIAVKISSSIKSVPSRFQSLFEIVIEALLSLIEGVAGKKQGREIFPLLATFFLFIILGNWSGLIPGVGSIGFYEEVKPEEESAILPDQNAVYAESVAVNRNTETNDVVEVTENSNEETAVESAESETSHEVFVPIFRGATADLNTTIALALISVFMIQYYGLKHLKLKYLKKFFDFSNPINAFIGILELVSDFSKIISFAFRLFGNIFAGEVLLTVISFLIPFLVPLPFIGLEIFVGFIQALVFTMLTLVFISMATAHH